MEGLERVRAKFTVDLHPSKLANAAEGAKAHLNTLLLRCAAAAAAQCTALARVLSMLQQRWVAAAWKQLPGRTPVPRRRACFMPALPPPCLPPTPQPPLPLPSPASPAATMKT